MLTALGVRVTVPAGYDAAADPAYAELLAGDGVPGQADARLTDVDTAELLLARLTEAVVRRSPLLTVHAAVVAGPRGVLVVPGHSGLGKTTLTAALVRAGFEYLSDEVLAVDRSTGEVYRFARPLSLAPDVWPLLGLAGECAPEDESSDYERQFAPSRFGPVWPGGPVRVSDVLLARRVAGGEPEVGVGSPSDAVTALLTRSFNHYLDPRGSLRTAAELVRDATVWSADYSDATQLAATMRRLLSD